ncbi:MAG: fructose-6-phosphate aldolase [Lachnospiraceae bacterium]|nr:fructose-6-phosphate aldolase [Lachnospiraceae bacterium]
MKLLVDFAGIERIRELYEYFPLDGVTTNPSILAAVRKPPYETLEEIRAFIGPDADLHAQVLSQKAEDMVEEAHEMLGRLGKNTCIKVPVVREGLKAIRLLAAEGVRVTGTAIYTPIQAMLAAHAGASFVAPYVNSIDNAGIDGMGVAKKIQETFENHGMTTQVLAASFKNAYQVQELFAFGIPAVTAVPDVLESLLKNDMSIARVARFQADFEKLCGAGSTMKQ